MGWEGWFTLAVVLIALIAMVREVAGPDLVMMAALFALAAAGILTAEETFLGFANPALAAIGALCRLAPDDSQVLDALRSLESDPDPRVRNGARHALARIARSRAADLADDTK